MVTDSEVARLAMVADLCPGRRRAQAAGSVWRSSSRCPERRSADLVGAERAGRRGGRRAGQPGWWPGTGLAWSGRTASSSWSPISPRCGPGFVAVPLDPDRDAAELPQDAASSLAPCPACCRSDPGEPGVAIVPLTERTAAGAGRPGAEDRGGPRRRIRRRSRCCSAPRAPRASPKAAMLSHRALVSHPEQIACPDPRTVDRRAGRAAAVPASSASTRCWAAGCGPAPGW